jgi:hypothetical protein
VAAEAVDDGGDRFATASGGSLTLATPGTYWVDVEATFFNTTATGTTGQCTLFGTNGMSFANPYGGAFVLPAHALETFSFPGVVTVEPSQTPFHSASIAPTTVETP